MNWKNEGKTLTLFVGIFLTLFYMPVGTEKFDHAILEAFHLAKWYAQEHVLLCLIPAFFIAGAIGTFIQQSAVMKYLGADAPKTTAYGVAAVSGTILAVCSCTVLPIFAGIHRMGAGLGPAVAFLYSGPAINALAIVLTANVLGWKLGVARAVGAITFSIVIGLLMHIIFHRDESERQKNSMQQMAPEEGRPLYQTMIYFGLMVAVLVFANWAKPETHEGLWFSIWSFKWYLTSFAGVLLLPVLIYWLGFSGKRLSITALVTVISALFYPTEPAIPFTLAFVGLSISAARDEKSQNREWFEQSWSFARQILPLLFFGVLAAGFLLGRVGNVGIIPSEWIYQAVGGNSISANFFASIAGAFMYFATLTEIPILQGLISNGMGQGPALALLLAGPALSLPNMLVIRSVMGTRKTITYVVLVIIMSTITGIIFGAVA